VRLLLRGRIVLGVGLIFLVGGVVATVNGIRITAQERGYRQRGEIVQATVTAKALQPATSDRGTSYEIAFRFIDTDGRPLEGRLPVDAAVWEPLGAGSLIAVRYVPGDPRSVRLADRSRTADVIILLGLGLAFGALGAGLTIWHGRALVRDWRIMRRGVPASATVTGTSATSVRVNRQNQWVVNYRYRDTVGRQHEGRSPYMPVAAARTWEPGTTADIRFDRDRPELSVWMTGERSPDQRQPSEAAVSGLSGRLRRLVARYGFVASLVLGGLALAVAAEVVPVLRDFVAYVDRHWRLFFTITAGAAAVGFVLIMGGIVHMALTSGSSGGRQDIGTSFGQIKAAWRQRAWRHDARWRYTFLIIAGALLLAFGVFSSVGLMTESFVRFLLWLALAYAMVRTAWAFYRA
jgi:Protein of unknown function (DUF3592)